MKCAGNGNFRNIIYHVSAGFTYRKNEKTFFWRNKFFGVVISVARGRVCVRGIYSLKCRIYASVDVQRGGFVRCGYLQFNYLCFVIESTAAGRRRVLLPGCHYNR